MTLTPEDLEKLQTKQLANVIRKLNSGKTLTAREEAMLAQARAVGGEVHAPGLAPVASGYVSTWDDLGKALGVSRRAIQDWRKDPRYRDHCPPDRADGRHEVAAWLNFMVRFRLKRADLHISPGSDTDGDDDGEDSDVLRPPLVAGSQAEWNVAIAALDHRKKATGVAMLEGTLLVASELEVPLGATFATIQTKLAQFPARVARYVTGLRDVGEVEDRLRDEIDADLSDLHAAGYVAENAIADAVASLPFDEETERLFQTVAFAGQDRTALLQLVSAVACEALRQLGRRAVQQARGDAATSDVSLSDPQTGPVTHDATARDPVRRQSAAVEILQNLETPATAIATPPKAAKKKRRPRPKPIQPPGEIEGAIHSTPKKKTTRHR